MMLPIAISIISVINKGNIKNQSEKNFAISLILSIAFSATIGGMATLIGTPPNAVMAGMLSKIYNYQINFLDWFVIGLPASLLLLTKICFPTNKLKNLDGKLILKEQNKLGRITIDEIIVCCIFSFTAFLWITRKWLTNLFEGTLPHGAITDANIAIGCLLYTSPSPRD